MIRPLSWLRGPVNASLAPFNLRLDTLTAARAEDGRLQALEAAGYFERPAFPVPPAFRGDGYRAVLDELPRHRDRFATFRDPAANDVGFRFDNGFFRSPDAEVLYAVLRRHRPARVLEVGCGHSTRVTRQAVRDGGWPCRLRCVDPRPRADVAGLADEVTLRPVESLDEGELAAWLGPGDCLFIDTSHEARTGGDVPYLFLRLLPRLAAGVLVHVHDVFLPYDYPPDLARGDGRAWNEQYLVQALLAGPRPPWEVLWPGFYLSRALPDFFGHFPEARGGRPQSLWLRTAAAPWAPAAGGGAEP